MKKVSVIILNYHVADLTIKCILSVKKSTYENIEIIVVDNNSNDGLDKKLENFPKVVFIQSKENVGYSGGNNFGIKRALEGGVDYVFILNPDVSVERCAIEDLVIAAERESISIAGPKVLFADKETIWYAGGIFDEANVIGSHRGVDERDLGQYNKEQETEYVSGGALFVSSKVFESIGLFDERYFLYYEDSDFCFRARKAGFKIMYIPQAVVYHENAKSTGLGSPLQDYYITRNRMLFAAKFLPFRTRFALFREGINNIKNGIRRKALTDFLFGNFGKGGI